MGEPRAATADGLDLPAAPPRSRRSARARVLGLAVMDLANPFFADVLHAMADAAADAGYAVRMGDSGGDVEHEAAHLRTFEQQRLHGVLLAPIGEIPEQVGRLRSRGIPVVLVDRASDDPGSCSVAVDDVEGGRLAVAHLTDQGHRRIAFVGGPGSLHQVRDRLLGAKLASAGYGDQLRLRTVLTTVLDVAAGRKAAAGLVALPPQERPTAVFAANDLLAIGLLQGLVGAGLRVPEDIALVGYDDVNLAAAAAVPLSSVRQPRAQLGRRATELLLAEMVDAARGVPHRHQQVRFVPELVVRASSTTETGGAGPGR
ncbi:substrate-binding domain-containing protein [uncultured Friedmanniella sp.]|uniref:substrate-binding domain-containing protein n=1 Tax=uncultured Friedmanniella sp. TaxID=335381 RepID=UPI0035CBC565